MSEYIVQEFFKAESILSIHLGQDGMLGFFASRYPTIIAMARSIIQQRNDLIERAAEVQEALEEARDKLAFIDQLKITHKTLSTSDQKKEKDVRMEIEQLKKSLRENPPLFFRGSVITEKDPEAEFISTLDYRFPGIVESLVELDRLIRIPLANATGQLLDWATLPVKVIIKEVVQRFNLGLAGHFMLLLVEQYPELIKERIFAEEDEVPEVYDELEVKGYGVKEIKNEIVEKYYS